MRVAIFESNLLWSERLRRGCLALGYQPTVLTSPELPSPPADIAILNLGQAEFAASEFIAQLHAAGTRTIGHAGHKEAEYLERGREAGVSQIVTNGTLHHKLAQVLGTPTD